jgi:hypothetical protein
MRAITSVTHSSAIVITMAIGWATHVAHKREMRVAQETSEKLKDGGHFGDLGVHRI